MIFKRHIDKSLLEKTQKDLQGVEARLTKLEKQVSVIQRNYNIRDARS